MTAAYFVLVNHGQANVTVTHLSAEPPLTATLHATHVHDGRAHMRALATLDIPAGARLAAAPGGLHAMLGITSQPLAEPVTLTFHCGDTALSAELPISRDGSD
jgi:copper(I)-binding protein